MKLSNFDLDGTLAEKWGTRPLPGVGWRLSRLDGHIAVATNQARVGWHAIDGDPYPRPVEVGRRLVRVAEALPVLEDALWLAAIGARNVDLPPERWRALAAAVTRAAAPLRVQTSSDVYWRKPRPGMLLEACETFSVAPDESLFVGDRQSEAAAAEAAGTDFVYADRCFDRA